MFQDPAGTYLSTTGRPRPHHPQSYTPLPPTAGGANHTGPLGSTGPESRPPTDKLLTSEIPKLNTISPQVHGLGSHLLASRTTVYHDISFSDRNLTRHISDPTTTRSAHRDSTSTAQYSLQLLRHSVDTRSFTASI